MTYDDWKTESPEDEEARLGIISDVDVERMLGLPC